MKIPKSIAERRASIRIEEKLPFKIGHEGFETEAVTLNISQTGAMCLAKEGIPLMTQMKVAIPLPQETKSSSKQKIIRAKGVVVRNEMDPHTGQFFIAIFFSEIKPPHQKILRQFIRHRLDSSS